MRVVASANTGEHLPESYTEHGYYKEYTFPILVGKSYVVYAMNLWAGKISYLMVGEANHIPIWVPSELFQITDNKLSRHWYYGINLDDSENTIDSVWGYKELTDGSDHFDKLVDWDKTAVELFMQYKELMDLEFPDPAISDVAETIEDGWFLCPTCCDAFESHSLDAMIRCPNCGTVLKNPKYIDV